MLFTVEQSPVPLTALSMSTIGLSSYRDRTAEFRSLSATLTKIGGLSPAIGNDPSTSNPLVQLQQATSSKSEFNKKASRLGLGIHETSQKIAKLAQLSKRSSMFDDPTVEIQQLTALIKDDITALNSAIADLQTLQNLELANGNYSDDTIIHSNAVCDDLKNRLMRATKQFQDVLTARTENIKAHENRKQIFSTGGSRQNPFQQHGKSINEPPPWSNSTNAIGSLPPTTVPSNGVQAGNQLRRRLAVDSAPAHQMDVSMLQEVVPQQESYSQGRASALRNVESTISELSGIFTHLATMVAQQGELAIRIDDNMDESLANVDGAHSALLKHLNRISSNRSLLIKIFAVLIFFLLVFIFFLV
ncbi:Syntaxin-31 [Ancistrocladus abbreviatus]